MKRRSESTFRFERDLIGLRGGSEFGFAIAARLSSERQERNIGRITTPRPLSITSMNASLVTQGGRSGKASEIVRHIRIGLTPVLQDRPVGGVSSTGHFQRRSIWKSELPNGQFVLGQCARLIRGNHRTASQAFNSDELTNDDADSHHPVGRDAERNRHSNWKTLRNRRHSEGHSKQEHLDGTETTNEYPQQRCDDRRE